MKLSLTARSKLPYLVSAILISSGPIHGDDGEGQFQSPDGGYQSPGDGGELAGGGEPDPGESGQGEYQSPDGEYQSPGDGGELAGGGEPGPGEGGQGEYQSPDGGYQSPGDGGELAGGGEPGPGEGGQGEYQSPDGGYQSPSDGGELAGGGEPDPGEGGQGEYQSPDGEYQSPGDGSELTGGGEPGPGEDGQGEYQSPDGGYQSPGDGGDYAGGGGPDQGGQEIPWPEGIDPREVLNHDNVKAIYNAILGHEPDPEGHEYWANSGIYTDDLVAALSPARPHPGEGGQGEYHSPDGGYQSPGEGGDYAGGGEPGPGEGGSEHHQPESEGLPIFEVKDFVGQWLDDKEHYQGAKVIWAEKLYDAIDNEGFVYEIGLDNGTSLIFDKGKAFLHSTFSDEFAENEFEEIDLKNTPELVRNSINSIHPEAEITELEMEFSLEPAAEGEEKSFHYLAVIEKDEESYELAINPQGEIIHTHAHEESEFEKNEWKPVELPTAATDYLREKYKDGDSEIPYWIEEREKPGGGKEFVAHLDNDKMVVVDENGTVLEERDLIQERLGKLDAGLQFDATRSSWGESNGTFTTDANSGAPATKGGSANALVVIQKLKEEVDEGGEPDMHNLPEDEGNRYRISLQNRRSGEGNATSEDFDLGGTDLPAGIEVSLTFTYQMEPPRYFVVSGAELTGFKHRKADWDKPGSFTIKAKTVDPVASQNNAEDSISSTFGILVEMGGERFHQGAIFVTNVIPQDVEGPDLSSPWDPVAGFRLNGLPDANASVRAYLPKQLLQGHFGIWDPADLKAAITRDDGSLSYLDFQRKPFKGFEPDAFDLQTALEFMLDETMFGLDAKGESIRGSEMDANLYPGNTEQGHPDSVLPYPKEGNLTPDGGYHSEDVISKIPKDPMDEIIARTDDRYQVPDEPRTDDGYQEPEETNLTTDGGQNANNQRRSGEQPLELANEEGDPVNPENGELLENPIDDQEGEISVDKSFIDFDGDGYVDSMLEVSLRNASWPAEIQIGDPWLDPFASIDVNKFGTIRGTVSDANGPLRDFEIWIEKAHDDSSDDEWEPVFFDLEINEANGSYVAKVPAGRYYVEASAYDPLTDTSHKPLLAGGEDEPRVFEIIDSNSSLSQDFLLESEYRVSHEMGEVSGMVTSGGEPIGGLAIELFPVDENNQSLSEHPVHILFVEPDGKIHGKAPAGTFRGEIVSWDNSYDDQNVLITIDAGGLRELPPIELTKRALATVSGRITDTDGNGVWAEVLFVDPNDEEEMTWPMEFEVGHDESTGVPTGIFTAKVPAGSYKILAQRFDGSLLPAYYGSGENNAADFASAEILEVTDANVSGVDLRLTSRPTATVRVQVVDSNTSEPVRYAWFLFHNAEDDQGEVIFPEVHSVNPFESNDFNGTYEIKVPGGTYKLQVEADGYEDAFRIIDESGATAWHNTDWDKGAPITLTDGNETNLGRATLKSFEKSEAERFGFAWMIDEDDEDIDDEIDEPAPVGASISGTVKTRDGTGVPKASIIAHTKDYLLWLDHVSTRADGSFELKDIPARDDWVVLAEPPFDSEAYRGFRESHSVDLNLMEANASGIALVLQSSNVYGKILFPRKDPATGETRNTPLANAHVWAYQDDDGDGEPDFDLEDSLKETEQIVFNEAFGETDEKGVFSFNLESAGQYALVIDLPGQLSALSPEPITFNVRNPDRDLKLGNAIRINWKSEAKANRFDIERKSTTESSFRSIFSSDDDKPTGKVSSFVDTSVKPGETYQYQVKAETAKGNMTLDSKSVKTSNPIIYLAPPRKTITGYVFDDSNNTVSGAEVVAWREEGEGWSSILSESDGSFELVAGPGKWEVTVYRPHDVKVDWIYEAQPKRIGFKRDTNKESKSINFTVQRASGGKITGSVALPSGKTSWANISQFVSIDALDNEGNGNWAELDSEGNFEIPLRPGNYEVSVWVEPELKGFASSEVKFARVSKDSVNVGAFALEARDIKLKGKVKTDKGKLLPNVEVWAWSEEAGYVSDVTNVNGAYSLAVSPGQWEVGFELLPAEDGSIPPYLPQPSKSVRAAKGKTPPSLDFTAIEAGAKVNGVVYAAGKAVRGIDAWAYAERANSDEGEFDEIVAEVPIDSRGKFEFPGVPGQYYVGLWMPPGSDYVNPTEKLLELDESGVLHDLDANGTVITEVAFNLEANDAILTGTLKLNGTSLTGLTGEVQAVKGDGGGWQTASVEDNGTYSMTLSPGRWLLSYMIESDDQSRNLQARTGKSIEVKAIKGQSVTQDFTLRSASATISGTVVDENNASVTGTSFVWVSREGTSTLDEFSAEVETDANGSFSLTVLPGGKYELGAYLPQDLRDGGYLEPKEQIVDLSTSNAAGRSLVLGKIIEDNFVEGSIRDDANNTLPGAYVYAWSDDGRKIEGEADDNGSYKLKVPKGTVWHIGADYGEMDDNGSETIYLADFELDADLRNLDTLSGLDVMLKKPKFEVPDGTNGTFDPSKDFVTKLPDGTEVTIPGGAANVPSTETSVRAVVTPTAKGLTKTANDQPAGYAYSIELFDSSGKKVEGNFKKDVILKIPVDKNAILAQGLDPNNMEAKFYSTTKNAWDELKSSTFDKNASVIYATTDHFTNIAAVSNADVSDLAKGLSKVDAATTGEWYNLGWFGNFYDAASGWVYHDVHGWLFTADAGDGNYWFFDAELGWFWTGPSYYDAAAGKYYVYSSSQAGWLYFTANANGNRKFYRYSDSSWITPDGSAYTTP